MPPPPTGGRRPRGRGLRGRPVCNRPAKTIELNTKASSGIQRGAARRAGEAGLQAQDGLRVELRDARLGDAQHLADLAQGQLLVVVERDDELLALGQARDRLAESLLELGLGEL